ncbi:MAG: transglutaminase domain-containing protein [Deltaproteobacteria bacterium]|nr:transglutaminase domain-containing protein [Deltaproteobacteria bacterium]
MTVRGADSKTKLPSTPAPSAPKASGKPAEAKNTAPAKTPSRNSAAEDRKGKSDFQAHAATVSVATDKLTPAAVGGRRVADTVMKVIGGYDKSFLLDTDGLKSHVQTVATNFIAAADASSKPGSVYNQLKSQFPGAQISLAGTASTSAKDQLVYLVRGKDNTVRSFVDQGGKAVEDPNASRQIFMAADLGKSGAHMAVRVPDVKFLIDPTLAPSYGVGRQISVVMDQDLSKLKVNAGDSVSVEMPGVYKETLPGTTKGEDGNPLGVVYSDKREMKGEIVKYDGNGTYDVKVTLPDGTSKVMQESESAIRSANDPMVYDLHGSTFDDVSINVDTDPVLKGFLDQAKAVAAKDIPATGTPEQIAAGQKQALVDLTLLCNKTMSYPDEDANTTDANSKQAMALMNAHSNWDPMKLGDLITAGRGVCRHQAILMQLACQEAGISSRTVSASANDQQGNFRGYHAFLETTLDDGTQYLTDPTWFDAGPSNVSGYNFSPVVNGQQETGTPLWDTLYYNVLRQTLPTWQDATANEDHSSIKFQENNNNVFTGGSTGGTSGTSGATTSDSAKTLKSIFDALTHVRVAKSSTPVTKGDSYLSQGHADKAAKEYALAISNGDNSKATWTKLAGALAKDSQTDLSNAATTIANGLK